MRLGESTKMDVESIPTGNILIDRALGVGGFPRGSIVEVFGPESSGKTTLTLTLIAQAQKLGGLAAFVDVEHALDPQYAKKLGVNLDDLLVSQPSSGEEALRIVETLVRSNALDVIVLDSVAALVTKQELEGEIGDSTVGAQARLMSAAMRKLTALISKARTICVFTNQIREKIGVMFGNPETTPGGKALKFYSSVRVDIRRIGAIKQTDGVVTGNRTKVKIVKNKVAPPFTEAEFDIMYNEGISATGSLLDLALEQGIVEKRGSWLSYKGGPARPGPRRRQGSPQDRRRALRRTLRRRAGEARRGKEIARLLGSQSLPGFRGECAGGGEPGVGGFFVGVFPDVVGALEGFLTPRHVGDRLRPRDRAGGVGARDLVGVADRGGVTRGALRQRFDPRGLREICRAQVRAWRAVSARASSRGRAQRAAAAASSLTTPPISTAALRTPRPPEFAEQAGRLSVRGEQAQSTRPQNARRVAGARAGERAARSCAQQRQPAEVVESPLVLPTSRRAPRAVRPRPHCAASRDTDCDLATSEFLSTKATPLEKRSLALQRAGSALARLPGGSMIAFPPALRVFN